MRSTVFLLALWSSELWASVVSEPVLLGRRGVGACVTYPMRSAGNWARTVSSDAWDGILSRPYISAAAASAATVIGLNVVRGLRTRGYENSNSVANAYDEWTSDRLVEDYWGDDVHLGYYTRDEIASGAFSADYRYCKKRFTEKLAEFGRLKVPSGAGRYGNPGGMTVLDLGCGLGGSSRWLAQRLNCHTFGISLSPNQVQRAKELTEQQGLSHQCNFQVMNAEKLDFPSNHFDAVWICESTEHMPNKMKVLKEVARVLKPGGKVVVAAWCQRDGKFSAKEKKQLSFLYDHWSHPPFASIKEYEDMLRKCGTFKNVDSDNWTAQTLPSWTHQLWLGFTNPLPWLKRPRTFFRNMKDAYCMLQMHHAFKQGLMEYGVVRAQKIE